jgi:uroporphyrinogen decarboxylase
MLMLGQPELWAALMTRLTETVTAYLDEQVRHGVAAIQLFDSWAGAISASDYSRLVLPYTRRIFASIRSVPRIHFCADSCVSLEEFHRAGPDVLSIDWRFPISEVWRRCGDETAVQGNLDPAAAAAGGAVMEKAVKVVLKGARGHPGHIFSLGHGVLRDTDPANLRRVVGIVHRATRSRR